MSLKSKIRYYLTMAKARVARSRATDASKPACIICGASIAVDHAVWTEREAPSCAVCGSNMRFRALIAAWQQTMSQIGAAEILLDARRDKTIVGLGMSDAGIYACVLAEKYAYTNTFFHMEPRLDVRDPQPGWIGRHDFVLSSDVLEHVDGDPAAAFANLRKLLKPGGVLAFTVPYGRQEATIEHYPDLHDYRIEGTGTARILVNRTKAGEEQHFGNLCFHGGDGSTLELRIYALSDVQRLLQEAGFGSIQVHGADLPQWGIANRHGLGLPITAIAA